MVAVALLSAAVSATALAQESVTINFLGGPLGGTRNMRMENSPTPKTDGVQVGPASITVDAKTHTAAVQFTNTRNDTVHTAVTVQDAAPGDSGAKTANVKSLASWIQDPPKQVTLAPHETRTVTLHLRVPSGLSSGDYSAYIVAQGQGTKLVYHAQ